MADWTYEVGCAWKRSVDPIEPVVTVEDVRNQAKISDTNSDSVLEGYVYTAIDEAEQYLGRGLLTQTWVLVLDYFANIIPLPMAAPLQSVTSVQYYDTSGTQQTLATSYYDTDLISRPGRVVLKPNQTWPDTQSDRRNGTVTITYVVGWLTPVDVPAKIRQGILQYVTYLDQDRDGLEPLALQARQAAERCWSDRINWTTPRWDVCGLGR